MTVTTEGFDEAADQLQRLAMVVSEHLPEAAEEAAKVVHREIQGRAPVVTGKLRSNVKWRRFAVGPANARYHVYVDESAYYGYMVETGQAGRAGESNARPFFRPGIDASRAAALDAMEREIVRASRRVTGS